MGYSLWDMSQTDADNTAFAGISQAENSMRAPAVNNAFRALDGALARFIADGGGTVTTGGSANAQTVTLNQAIATTVPTGFFFTVKFGYSNTSTTVTLNVNSIGAKSVKVLRGGALADPAVGEIVAGYYGRCLYDGTYLVLLDCGLPQVRAIRTQAFTSSGTYTPDANLVYCVIECVGGGGSGGAVGGALSFSISGGGGGSGGYSRTLKTAAQIGASQSVTIGAGGTATVNAGGNSGGTTSVGTLCVANGGAGGANASTPGSGGTAGTGDLTIAGSAGSIGQYTSGTQNIVVAGTGGASFFGGAGRGGAAVGSAIAAGLAGATGSGGGGSAANNNNGTPASGAGGPGVVVITEFCSA